MVKLGSVITVGFIFASGCAFVDTPAPQVESLGNSGAALESDTRVSMSETDTPSATPAPTIPARTLNADEIRRMQVRLRDVGLDPGPIDGVAGAKTGVAAKRFHSGCAELQTLIDGLQGAQSKPPNRQETLTFQHQLRNAGLNPGPLDGIFGARMKAIFSHLQNGCPVAQDFVLLSAPAGESAAKSALSNKLAERPNSSRAVVAQSRHEAAEQVAAPLTVRPQEDIRILQLRLRDAGYDPGPFDGIMGPKTKLALLQMQAHQRSGKAKTTVTAGIGAQY